MKILHITPHLGGGIGSVVFNWIKKDNSDNSHKIICLDKNNGKDWIEIDEQCENVTIHDACYFSDNFETLLKGNITSADIVLLHWWNHPLLYDVMINFQWPACRLLLWNHSAGLFPPYIIPEELLGFVDYFVATSPVSHECKEDLDVIWSTGDIEGFENIEKIPHDGFNVGYVGTVEFGKLNRNFINLCSQVNVPDINFIVVSGDSQQHLMDEAVNTGILEKFTFLGQVGRSHIPDILSKIDVFGYPLQPLHFGTCEQVLGEAMMAGCVPVVLPNPAEKYIVKHMETGIVANTLEEYPCAIEYLYKNNDLRKQLAENAKIFAKKQYDIAVTIRKWNELFDKAMNVNKRERVWAEKKKNLSPAELYIESLGEYSLPLKEMNRDGIKQLFDSNPMFYSKNKGSVLQYLQFFPEDKVLQSWADCL